MDEKKNIQEEVNKGKKTQNTPLADEKVQKSNLKPGVMPKKKTAFQKFLRSVALAFAFLLIGAALVFFFLYYPNMREFNNAKQELARLQQIEMDYKSLQENYSNLQEKHTIAVVLVDIFKIQNNVNVARIALLEDDQIGLSQSLAFIEENIDTLDISAFPDINIDLKARFSEVQKALPADNQKALFELGRLHKDLLRLASNLEITD